MFVTQNKQKIEIEFNNNETLAMYVPFPIYKSLFNPSSVGTLILNILIMQTEFTGTPINKDALTSNFK